MQEISKLPVFTGTIPNKAVQNDDEFANNIFGFLNYSGNIFVYNFNQIVGQVNTLSGEIVSAVEATTEQVNIAKSAKEAAVDAKEAAIIARNEAQAIYDNFDDRYLGLKSTPPTLDNDGEPLRQGALYCKESTNPTENGLMYVYDLQLGDWVNLSFVPTLLASLTDVFLTTKENNNILQYNSSTQKWENKAFYSKSQFDAIIEEQQNLFESLAVSDISGLSNLLVEKAEITGDVTKKFLVADGTGDNDAVNKKQLNTAISSIVTVPTGTVITFVGLNAPIGYIKGNGALLSRTTFANLWAFAQSSGALVSDAEWSNSKQGCFSTGDGSTTFRIPDLRGVTTRAWDDGRGIDASRVLGSYQADAYLNHSHTASTDSQGAHTHTLSSFSQTGNSGLSTGYGASISSLTTSSAGAHTHTITVNASTTGATETRPKNIALLYCIKY